MMPRWTDLAKRGRDESGAALAETAIVLGVLVLLTFGAMEFGWLFFRMQQISEAARAGVRNGVLESSNNGSITGVVDSLMSDFGMSGHSVSVSADVTGLALGQIFTVYVTVPYSNVDLLGLSFLPLPDTLSASASMAKERAGP